MYLGPLTSHTQPPPLVITIHMELHAREKELERASKLYEHFARAARSVNRFAMDRTSDELLADAADRLVEAAERWSTAFEHVVRVEAAALEKGYPPNTTTEFWEADQKP